MQSKATTVQQYLRELSPDRRAAIQAVRETILQALPKGYEEGMQYGMIGYYVPHSLYPDGYHCDPKQPLPFAHLASQKNYMSIYLFCNYSDAEQRQWFEQAWTDAGKKLDAGKSCVRFKTLDDVPLKVVGQAIARYPVNKFIKIYESAIKTSRPGKKKQQPAKTLAKKKKSGTRKKTGKKASKKRK